MEDFPHDRETLGLEMLEGLGGVTVKVRGSGQPLQSSSEEATSQLLCAHLRTVPFHLQKSKTLRNFRLKISPQIPL